uniref:Uncharacterized protein n=1 Tax=Picea sitchensis TaxID=3332 RepID=A9NZV5_PICSI|nr:unknown [Picea sitchensis]
MTARVLCRRGCQARFHRSMAMPIAFSQQQCFRLLTEIIS